jgi:NitT/TauT family transport system substrate-binding protein
MTPREPLPTARTAAFLVAVALSLLVKTAAAETPVRFSLEGRLDGPASIYLVPQDKGYYRQEGLDVAIDEGSSLTEPIMRVASGTHDMGVADINLLIRYRDQHPGTPVVAVFMVYNNPPFSIVARKSRGIAGPKDLEGKRLGAPLAGSTFPQWPLFAKLNEIDVSKVKLEQIGAPVRAPMLAAGQLDAALGFSYRVYVDLKNRGVPVDDIVLMPMSIYGLSAYGNTILVNTKFAAEKPEIVKRFLRGFVRGLEDTIQNPAAAIDSVVKRDDSIQKDVEVERLRMAIRDNIVTPETRAKGFGAVDTRRLDEAIEQMATVYPFKAKPKAEEVFDPGFLPRSADRRSN